MVFHKDHWRRRRRREIIVRHFRSWLPEGDDTYIYIPIKKKAPIQVSYCLFRCFFHFRSWLPEGDDAADAEPCCAGYRGRMERGSKSQVSEAPRILVSVCMPPDDSAKRHHIQHMLAATCCNILHENHAVMGVGLAIRQSTFALLRLGIYPASPETGVIAFIRAQGLCV